MDNRIVVCVTRQKNCRRLIQYAADMRDKRGDCAVTVVHVVKHGDNFLGNDQEGQALEFLFQTAKEYGADMFVLKADDVTASLKQYAEENNARCMVLGRSPEVENPYIKSLGKQLQGVEMIEI